MDSIKRAEQQHKALLFLTESLPDEQAAQVPAAFPEWKSGTDYEIGNRVENGDLLYKCRQDHTSQAQYPPNTIPALWEVIDVSHAGTKDDPIPAARNMEYVEWKYYSDPEDGKVYFCTRSTGQPVAYLPHELVGQYFEEAI